MCACCVGCVDIAWILRIMHNLCTWQVDLLVELTDSSRHEAKVALLATKRDMAGTSWPISHGLRLSFAFSFAFQICNKLMACCFPFFG